MFDLHYVQFILIMKSEGHFYRKEGCLQLFGHVHQQLLHFILLWTNIFVKYTERFLFLLSFYVHNRTVHLNRRLQCRLIRLEMFNIIIHFLINLKQSTFFFVSPHWRNKTFLFAAQWPSTMGSVIKRVNY